MNLHQVTENKNIRTISHKNMGKSEMGWLHSTFHFSFAEYFNPDNMNFGALRVVNDDIIDANSGFPTHPHKNMEIVSYVVDGNLTHKDSMGNQRTLTRGQVQYMSAGTGVTHSEYNLSADPLRILQIWVLPDKDGYTPNYGDYLFPWEDRDNKWLQIVSGGNNNGPIKIHQDMIISVISLDAGAQANYTMKDNRQAYLIQIEGTGSINGQHLDTKDAAEILDKQITIEAATQSHYILFDMLAV